MIFMITLSKHEAELRVKTNPKVYQYGKKFLWFPTKIGKKMYWLVYVVTLQQYCFEVDAKGRMWSSWYDLAFVEKT